MPTLQCHSRGNTDYSPLYCYVEVLGKVDTIENHYQATKVFLDKLEDKMVYSYSFMEVKKMQDTPLRYEREGFWFPHFEHPQAIFLGTENSKKTDLVIQYYISLWYKHLKKYPEKVEYASQYDDFVDIFKGKFPYCQADVIRDAVNHGVRYLYSECVGFLNLLKEHNVKP
jgi:DNA phosphorothioation-dependent restriction protein DptG